MPLREFRGGYCEIVWSGLRQQSRSNATDLEAFAEADYGSAPASVCQAVGAPRLGLDYNARDVGRWLTCLLEEGDVRFEPGHVAPCLRAVTDVPRDDLHGGRPPGRIMGECLTPKFSCKGIK